MISIICPSNNKDKFENFKRSLEKQTYTDFELICVDTDKLNCKNAVEALNSGVKLANSDIFIFSHNDIEFQNQQDLEDIVDYINRIKDFGIIGVAGAKFERIAVIGNIYNGIPKREVSQDKIDKETDVQTLDECLFIIKRETLEKYPFNENNKTWHLYAVDYSLQMNNLHKKVAVIPSNIYHQSAGSSINNDYYVELKKICKKYKKEYKSINTTMGYWNTNPIKLFFQILRCKFRIIKLKMKKEI